MIILVNSKINSTTIQASLGKPEYSYYFLLSQFMPALQQFARVIEVDSHDEVDSIYKQLSASGETVVFLSVSPPQQTPIDFQCPTVCLFAWEFHNSPDQAWGNEPRNDWRYTLQHLAGAIACSHESAQAVRNLMGEAYPVAAIPAPVWAHFGDLLPTNGWQPCPGPRSFEFSGHAIDSLSLGLSANGLVQHIERPTHGCSASKATAENPGALSLSWRLLRGWLAALCRSRVLRAPLLPAGEQPAPNQAGKQPVENCYFDLSGVVFCSVFSPSDARKNWHDIVTAFCWAFRDTADATLILKMTHHDLEFYRIQLLTLLSRLAPFKCRVLTLHGFLDDGKYRELVGLTDFYVSASTGEGLCLPLMEFLSAGKPSLTPRHTAMADYVNEEMAYIVETSEELACWPNDPVGTWRTRRHRLNWQSLMEGYLACYELAKDNQSGYQQMSRQAWRHMRDFADTPIVADQLQSFLTPLLVRREKGDQA